MAKIVTTREIFVHLSRGERKLERTTTKHVDASIKVIQPKNPQKPVTLSTAGLPDVQDIIDKKKRDDILIQRKLALKDEKKLAQGEKKKAKVVEKAFKKGDAVYQDAKGNVVVIPKSRRTVEDATEEAKDSKPIEKFAEQVGAKILEPKVGEEGKTIIDANGDIRHKGGEEKKPWKEMTLEERDAEVEKQIQEPMKPDNVNLEKEPMKEMTQEEKKLAMQERMAKVRAGKDKKKKEDKK